MVVSDLQKFYRSAKEAFDEDDEFRKKAQTLWQDSGGGRTFHL